MDETCLSDYGETLTMTDFATSATLPDHDPLDFCTNPVELISSFGKRKFEDAEFSNDEESTETSSDYWEWTEEMVS